ncbi:hypothetical protein Rsub_05517 [Raphidocelis subcapitata]|uniref:Fe2OG dioxygenase domain-containing protein n=1 Tax=Raphidocelis subcapitata TaxID=307507 RepID=A0A2V0P5F2_9CHLO|nr:hypothetical protein Rsub_05517 [Raphidocelis subcapitata]|eukprot:GBF92315.1 hypothetical protein Rsub_05517 [Raphidocelis subcapitata]
MQSAACASGVRSGGGGPATRRASRAAPRPAVPRPPGPTCWPAQLPACPAAAPRCVAARAASQQQPGQRLAAASPLLQRVARPQLARQQQQRKKPPAVVYLPNFLHPDDFETVRREFRQLSPKLRAELNTVAVGRLGCYLPRDSPSVAILSSPEVAEALTERLRAPTPLRASDFPMELRTYQSGAHMPWHRDEQLYDLPQWECIYTVENSSDSVTQWRDETGALWEQATDANSLLAVLAEAWDHRVTPARRGSRAIIKLIYTSSGTKLPAFHANLSREAYQD